MPLDLGTVPDKPDLPTKVTEPHVDDRRVPTVPIVGEVSKSDSSRSMAAIVGLALSFIAGIWIGSVCFGSGELDRTRPNVEAQGSNNLAENLANLNEVMSKESTQFQKIIEAKERENANLKARSQDALDELAQLRIKVKEMSAQLDDFSTQNRTLKSQITPLSPAVAEAVTSPTRAEPVENELVNVYVVERLLPGDYLNLRSGPSSDYSIVGRLDNGVRLRVTGAAVANSPDFWLPCVVDVERSDTSVSRTNGRIGKSELRGWINSAYVKQIAPNGR